MAVFSDTTPPRAPEGYGNLRGERGFVTEGDAADFVARVPQASVLTVPSGHNVQEELPAPLAALVFDIADA